MAVVTIVINNKPYQIACSDGQEEKVQKAANSIADQISELKRASRSAPIDLLLVMTALGLQDEVFSLREKLARVGGPVAEDEKVAETLSTIAGYIETIAQKMTK